MKTIDHIRHLKVYTFYRYSNNRTELIGTETGINPHIAYWDLCQQDLNIARSKQGQIIWYNER